VQRVVVCCSVLQCVAVSCCSVLQCCIECDALCKYVYIYSGTNGVESVTMLLQCVAVCWCSVLQCVGAVCCSVV